MNKRNIWSHPCIKGEVPHLKELAEKMCANKVTLWRESKKTMYYSRKIMGNIGSTDNDSNDLDGERSKSNIDILVD